MPYTSNAFPNFSPSLNSKKSNELLQGGLISIKNAATSVAKKFDEIKEAISANTTPVKTNNPNDRNANHIRFEDDVTNNSKTSTRHLRLNGELDLWSRLNESRKSSSSSLVPLCEHTVTPSTSSSKNFVYPVLPDSVYPLVRLNTAEIIYL